MHIDSIQYMQIKLILKRILTGFQFGIRLAYSTLIFGKEFARMSNVIIHMVLYYYKMFALTIPL